MYMNHKNANCGTSEIDNLTVVDWQMGKDQKEKSRYKHIAQASQISLDFVELEREKWKQL